MNRKLAPIALGLFAALAAPAALAQSAGAWAFGFGVHNADPKSNNGRLVDNTLRTEVSSNVRPTITGEYFIADNLGLEVLASLPFEHDIKIPALGGRIGSVKHLPPTVSLQYHFGDGHVFRPFIGGGLNYTYFFSEDTRGALRDSKLRLKNSWGLAAHVGADFALSDNSAIRVDARWIDIDTDVRLNGAKVGTVNIDPIVYGAAYVVNF